MSLFKNILRIDDKKIKVDALKGGWSKENDEFL